MNLYGPEPTGCSFGSFALMAFSLTMSPKAASAPIRPPQFGFVMIRTDVSFTTSTPLSGVKKIAFAADSVLSKRRSKVYFTSAPVNFSPLWKKALSTRLNSQVVSLSCFHDFASPGMN